jgi:hypothetical protein
MVFGTFAPRNVRGIQKKGFFSLLFEKSALRLLVGSGVL